MKKILVAGGAGFIGSHLCKKLVENGHEVICVDNLQTGQKSNISDLLTLPNFLFFNYDIKNSLYQEVDEIYNLACPASPIHYQHDAINTIKTNVIGSLNMLGLARQVNAKILQASTSEVYGDPKVHPQDETYFGHVNPVGPRSCYDEGKRCAESLFVNYRDQYSVDTKIVRIFNTYGPNMALNDGRVISNFIVQALKGKNITIYGKGTQTRSFMYVSDLVNGLIEVMSMPFTFMGPVNLGNPNELSILRIAEKIIQMTNSKSVLSFHPLPEDDPWKRQPDITMAKTEIGWAPEIGLDEGLTKTIEYFRGKLNL